MSLFAIHSIGHIMSWKLPTNYSTVHANPLAPSTQNGLGLSTRLETIASFVEIGSRIVDIGTDHALLPAALVSKGRAASAIAVDIKPNPIARAAKLISSMNLSHKIQVRLGNGLSVVRPNEADTAIVAGLSGDKIANILANTKTKNLGIQQLIVQPNTNPTFLRQELTRTGWTIINESMVVCGSRSYLIIVLKIGQGSSKLSFEEALLGPILSKNPSERIYRMWVDLMLQRYTHKVRSCEQNKPNATTSLEKARAHWLVFNRAYQDGKCTSNPPRIP